MGWVHGSFLHYWLNKGGSSEAEKIAISQIEQEEGGGGRGGGGVL
jgi:hypothetical protein